MNDGEREYYTPDELDNVDKSMDYLARKFSNLRFKKPRTIKGKGQSSFTNSFKRKAVKTNTSGYRTSTLDRAKIRCLDCDEMGHFPT